MNRKVGCLYISLRNSAIHTTYLKIQNLKLKYYLLMKQKWDNHKKHKAFIKFFKALQRSAKEN